MPYEPPPRAGAPPRALDVAEELRAFRKNYDEEHASLLRTFATYDRHFRKFEERLAELEKRSSTEPPGRFRAESPSLLELKEILAGGAEDLQKRIHDPRDRMNSERAREIAKEVVEATRTVDDAKALRSLKTGGRQIALEAVKWLAIATLGFVTHWVLKGGR